jgi:hypothetical protein
LHEGHFAGGSIYSGQLEDIAKELQCLGYFVLIGDYRLAPCGLIEGQTAHSESTQAGRDSGRPVQQKNDIKSLIRAARNDGRVGKLGVLGSSGATHAAWVAIDQTPSTVWPVWNKNLRPDAVACLSGAYDFSDRSMPGLVQDAFVQKLRITLIPVFEPSKESSRLCVRLKPRRRTLNPFSHLTVTLRPCRSPKLAI